MPDYTILVYTPDMFVQGLRAEGSGGTITPTVSATSPYTLTLRADAKPIEITIRDEDTGSVVVGGQTYATSNAAFNEVTNSQTILSSPFTDGPLAPGSTINSAYNIYTQGDALELTAFRTNGNNSGVDTGAVQGVMTSALLTPGESYTFVGTVTTQNDPPPYSEFVPCFTAGTLIRTPDGEVPVESLRVGDLVMTRDRGSMPIRWIGSRYIPASALAKNDRLIPIRISAGALGDGMPKADLVVSPQHRILVRSSITQSVCGEAEILIAAKKLLGLKGITLASAEEDAHYLHVLLDRHEVIFANGAETETLLLGEQAVEAIGEEARAEILAIFPELGAALPCPISARPIATGREARRIALQHARHGHPVYELAPA